MTEIKKTHLMEWAGEEVTAYHNQYDPDSEEWSQHAVTPHHNYHYNSGTTNNTYADM
jgi:hypothetical protein